MKKAQIQQVFIYLMAIIVIGTILFIGLRAMMDLGDKACEAQEVTFKQDLERAITKYTGLGSLGHESIKVPCEYEELCFINTTMNCDNIDNEIIKQECNLRTGYNVFVKKGIETKSLFSIENLNVDGYLCINATGNRYNIKFEGLGRRQVLISKSNS
jgi:hypothetical protein